MRPRPADLATVEALFRAHFDAIYRFALYRVGPDLALDVAAETFARALRKAHGIDPALDARAWLYGIASNILRHHHRAEGRRLRAYARHVAEPGSAEHADPLLTDRLVEALLALSPRDREALLLFAWAELSYDEIALSLDIPVGTVRSRIHRARSHMRQTLEATEQAPALATAGKET